LSDSVLSTIAAALTQKYGHKVSATSRPNPALIAGIKVSIADDVYESSVAGQLSALASAV
jgi:F-type H+-transporting ATPase subunit delta